MKSSRVRDVDIDEDDSMKRMDLMVGFKVMARTRARSSPNFKLLCQSKPVGSSQEVRLSAILTVVLSTRFGTHLVISADSAREMSGARMG